MKHYFETLSDKHKGRIAGLLRLFNLDPKEHFKGSLNVPAGKTYTLMPGTRDEGCHSVINPDSIQHAKYAVGIPDSAFDGYRFTRPLSKLIMVSPEKTKSKLSRREIRSLHEAARYYLFNNSGLVAHMEAGINAHVLERLQAGVHIYTQLDLKGELHLEGGGDPAVLIVHTLNMYPGATITVDQSPLIVNSTVINYITDEAAAKDKYDVSIVVHKNQKAQDGQDGQNGTDYTEPAAQGSAGKSVCCGSDIESGAGEAGQDGGNGEPGKPGNPGESSPDTVWYVETMNCSVYVEAVGSDGGDGGDGGSGGKGQDGGAGGKGDGVDDGNGGSGGDGGSGGGGDSGGNGGGGGVATLYAEDLTTKIFDGNISGGKGGIGGIGGTGGSEGKAGSGHIHGSSGNVGSPGVSGNTGAGGEVGNVIVKKAQPPVIDAFSPISGPTAVGTPLTITGKNFYRDTGGNPVIEFTLNGQPLSNVVIIGETTASGVTPENPAGMYPLVAFNKETKAAAVSLEKFTYEA